MTDFFSLNLSADKFWFWRLEMDYIRDGVSSISKVHVGGAFVRRLGLAEVSFQHLDEEFVHGDLPIPSHIQPVSLHCQISLTETGQAQQKVVEMGCAICRPGKIITMITDYSIS